MHAYTCPSKSEGIHAITSNCYIPVALLGHSSQVTEVMWFMVWKA